MRTLAIPPCHPTSSWRVPPERMRSVAFAECAACRDEIEAFVLAETGIRTGDRVVSRRHGAGEVVYVNANQWAGPGKWAQPAFAIQLDDGAIVWEWRASDVTPARHGPCAE